MTDTREDSGIGDSSAGAPPANGRPTIISATAACWALLFSMALGMLSNGLQGPLIGLRASFEGFPTWTTGFVMSGYFAGFAAGSLFAPRLVRRVGHVRVFAALASLASVVPLLHSLLIEPAFWFAMRVVTGFAYAGIYVIAESWLNDRATNHTRGMLLSIYMVVNVGAMAAGPLLLNVSHPMSTDLFVLASVIVSFAVIPILLAASPAPSFTDTETLSVGALYRLAPLSVIGIAATGMSNGTIVGMGAVYADSIGLSIAEVSYFGAIALAGSLVLQWPIGWISDRFDRRKVLAAVTFLAALVAVAAVGASLIHTAFILVAIAVFGGLAFPMYSLCLSHANDRLNTRQMVAASSTLVLANGVGATLGPYGASLGMSTVGSNGFFWFLAAVHLAIGLYAVNRIARRKGVPMEQQESYSYDFGQQPGIVSPAMTYESMMEWSQDSAEDLDPESTARDGAEQADGTPPR